MAMPLAAEVIDALPQAALLIGRSQRIEGANPAAHSLLGPNLVGRHYVTALRQPAVIEAIEKCGADGKPREARYLARDRGRDTTFAAHVAPAGTGLLVSFEDRTAAERAGEMRRDFVANVSHELKTPLTAMIGFIETLQGPARNDDAARERFLATMAREARRMNRLVTDLLSLSRVEANERIRPREPVDLDVVIASCCQMLSGTAEDRNITLSYERAPEPVILRGDADQLRQVFSNLIENAIKYGGTRVEMRLSRHQQVRELRRPGVLVDVIDNGPGIDQLHLPRLTERFYRVDTHRSREVGGTGLGLAIVKHIVSRHRGRVRIASTKGAGSIFTVVLPLDP